jgi:uncharacterized protein (TIGR03435 family)
MRHPQESLNRFSLGKTLSLARVLAAGPLVVSILSAPFLRAQPAIPPPTTAPIEFEVASVKPRPLSATSYSGEAGGPGTTDPGQITWSGGPLKWLLVTAYDVKPYQVSGPAWLDSEGYVIVAKVPQGATKEQLKLMWQNLLKNRFGVVIHHESRVFQAEEMTLVKGASKLKETDLPDPPPRADSAPQTTPGKDSKTSPDDDLHRYLRTPGWTVAGDGANRRLLARAQSLAQVASILEQFAGHPVIDKTGLSGKYDFSAELDLSQPCASCVVAIALEQELGLKLVKTTVQLDVIVVDHAEKTPVEN